MTVFVPIITTFPDGEADLTVAHGAFTDKVEAMKCLESNMPEDAVGQVVELVVDSQYAARTVLSGEDE